MNMPAAIQYYRLLAGDHIGNDENGVEKLYRTGEAVPSTTDLEARWPEKFRRVDKAVLEAAREGFGEGHSPRPEHAQSVVAPRQPHTGPGGVNDPEAQKAFDQDIHGQSGQAQTPYGQTQKSPQTVSEEDLKVFDSMSESELKKYAEEEEIDLKGVKGKAAITERIKKVVKGE
jgi:hypothetical protein